MKVSQTPAAETAVTTTAVNGTDRAIAIASTAMLLLAIALRFAEPLKDGDLFWHMAYARQILATHSLIPDATIYSWTPASGAMIYCSWLSQIALYGLWSLGGATAMFALRYAAVLLIVALLWQHARRFGLARRPWIPALLLVVVLAAAPVTPTKPELFSVLFTHLLLWLFYGARHADQHGRSAAPWLWTVPLLVTVWINCHGGVILAAPLLLAMWAGDLCNRRVSPTQALSAPAQRTLTLAWMAAAVATLITPYGLAYPRQLIDDYLLGTTPRPDVAWNSAHQNLFSTGGWSLHLPEYGLLMVLTLTWLAWRRRRERAPFDTTALLMLLVAVPLFIVYLRSTYLLPAVFGYVAISLLPEVRQPSPGSARAAARGPRVAPRTAATMLAAVGALTLPAALTARTAWEMQRQPEAFGWWGFGIGYINPVEEAEWLSRHPLGPRLYNIFDSGGYLLWRLYPDYKVMVDSRSFPYLGWFDDQYRFTMGERFDSFLSQYPGDVAVIDLAKASAWRNFLRSTQWRPIFFGATAAIFVRRDDTRAQALRYESATGLATLRNGDAALRVFDFAVDVGDWRTAWMVASELQGPLRQQIPAAVLSAVDDHRQAYQLAVTGHYADAAERLNRALARKVAGDNDMAMLVMLQALALLRDPGTAQARQIQNGLQKLLQQRE